MSSREAHLRRRYPKGLTDLGIELPHVAEALDAACGASMSELGVEDEARPHAARRRGETIRRGSLHDAVPIQVHPRHIETRADGLRFLILHQRGSLLPSSQTQRHCGNRRVSRVRGGGGCCGELCYRPGQHRPPEPNQ